MALKYWDGVKSFLAKGIGSVIAAPRVAANTITSGFIAGQAAKIAPESSLDVTKGFNESVAAKNARVIEKSNELATKAVDTAAVLPETVGIATAADKVFEQVDALYTAARPVVTRPLATSFLAQADFAAGRGFDLAKNWNMSKEISPGQASASFYSEYLDAFGITDYAVKNDVKLPAFLDPNFNIAAPAERKKAFQEDIYGRIVSGGIDGFLSWYTDPLVLAGKGIATSRRLIAINPINSAEDVFKLRSDLDVHGMWLKTDGTMGRETPIGIVAQRLVKKSPTQALVDPIVKNSTNPRLLASLTGNAKSYDDVADIIGAATGDITSMKKLEASQASVADQIKRTQEILDPVQKRLLSIDFGKTTLAEKHFATDVEYKELSKVLDDLKSRNQNIAYALSERVGDYRLINDFTAGVDKTVFGKNVGVGIENLRNKLSQAEHNLTFFPRTFSDGFLGRRVTALSMASNKLPNGIVRVDGGPLADSATEVKAILNSIPELRTAEKGIDFENTLAIKTQLLDDYLSADSALGRRAAIKQIEQEGINLTAARYNIDPSVAEAMYRLYDDVRQDFIKKIDSFGSYVDENGDILTSPFWKSEMPNVVPVIDFKAFDKFLRANQDSFARTKTFAQFSAREVEEFADIANSYFKVAVLTRLGYPIRNTIEGQVRVMTILGSIVKADDVLANFAKNSATRAKIASNYLMNQVTLKNPRQLNSIIGKYVNQRSGFIEARTSILDELAPAQYYAGATGTFGMKIPKGDVETAIASPTKSILNERDRSRYSKLQAKMQSQSGLLYGKDREQYVEIMGRAYQRYIREEVRPNLPQGTTLVYADAIGGGIYYKVEGKRIPKEGIGDFETRRGIPVGALEEAPVGPTKVNIRGKAPEPDIRIMTSYEKSREMNYENLAELLGDGPMQRIRFFTEAIEKNDDAILKLVQESADLTAIRSELKIVRSGEKPFEINAPNGKPITFDGAFMGPASELKRAEASGSKTLNWMSEQQAYTTFDAAKGSGSRIFGGYFTGEAKVVHPTDPQYWDEMARISNDYFRTDQLAQRLLKGESDADIATWLRGKEGQFYLRELVKSDVKKSEIMLHIQEARTRVYKTLPDPLVRNLVYREELSPRQFEALMRDTPNLDVLAGQEFIENGLRFGKGAIRRSLDDQASKIINTIGSMPEDRLVSWPFYQRLYENSLRQEVRLAERAGKNIQDADWITQAQRTAHDTARTTLNKTLYRVYNNTGASSLFRFVVPFYNAQYNALWFYGKTFVKDPSKLARASMIWNAPNRVATVVDEEGNPVAPGAGFSTPQYLMFTLDAEQRKRFNLPEGYNPYIPKNSLNIFLQGENPIVPALGLPVLIPTSIVANSKPNWINNFDTFIRDFAGPEAADTALRTILPFGRAAKEPVTMALPAWMQKTVQRLQGDTNAQYSSIVGTAMRINEAEWQDNGKQGPRPGYKEGQELANQLYKIRIGANLTLPVAVTFKPEWQNIINDYIRALKDPIVGPDKVFDYLYSKYGLKGLYVTGPTGKSVTGVVKTIGAVKNVQTYPELIATFDKKKLPLLAGFIANYGSLASGGEDYSSNYFTDKKLRTGGNFVWSESRSAADVVLDREVQIGWWAYQKEVTKRDVALAQQGIYDINSKAAQNAGYTDRWKAYEAALKKKFPAWGEEKDNPQKTIGTAEAYIKGLTTLVSEDSKWMKNNGSTAGAQAISNFVVNREYLVRELQRRKSEGGSPTLSNESNADLQEKWSKYIVELKLYSNDFSDLYNRILENDKLGVIQGLGASK